MRPQRQRRRPPQAPVNKYVKALTLTVIDDNGEKLGVFSKDEAIKIAEDKGLDLLQITFDKEPCVAKILDYGKHKFDQKKKQSAAKKHQKKIEQKEIKMRPNIDTGDMFLSNIYFNDKNSKNLLEEIVKINNMLILKSTLRDILP